MCSYRFCKVYKKHLKARLSLWLSCRASACSFIKKESDTVVFLWILKVFRNMYFKNSPRWLHLCSISFSANLVKKAFWIILQNFRNIFEIVLRNLVSKLFGCGSGHQYIVIWKYQNPLNAIASLKLFEDILKDLPSQETTTPLLLKYSENSVKTACVFRFFF